MSLGCCTSLLVCTTTPDYPIGSIMTAHAWLLDTGLATPMAIGQRELLQIITAPQTFSVPLCPEYARHVLFWQQRMVPVMDFGLRMGANPHPQNLLALVGFHDALTGVIQLGAIVLRQAPRQVAVNDAQALQAEDLPVDWRALAISCFAHEGSAIPVLHLGKVFAAGH